MGYDLPPPPMSHSRPGHTALCIPLFRRRSKAALGVKDALLFRGEAKP
jgi:hypothetical protein